MQSLAAVLLLAAIPLASAGPMRAQSFEVRDDSLLSPRYVVVDPGRASDQPVKRHEGHGDTNSTVSSLISTTVQAAETATTSTIRRGTENGKVPAVGAGSGNTSLLPFLKNTTLTVDESGDQQATFTTTTTFTAQGSSDASSTTSRGSEQGEVPAVGVGSGNTSLIPFLTNTTLTASATETKSSSSTAQATRNTIVPVKPPTPSDSTAPAGGVTSAQVASSTATIPNTPAPQAAHNSPSTIIGTIFVSISVSTSVSTVFVTLSPTFSSSVAGFTTLTPDASTVPTSASVPIISGQSTVTPVFSSGAVSAPNVSDVTPTSTTVPALGLITIPNSVSSSAATTTAASASSADSDIALGFTDIPKSSATDSAASTTEAASLTTNQNAAASSTASTTTTSSADADVSLGFVDLPKSSSDDVTTSTSIAMSSSISTPSPSADQSDASLGFVDVPKATSSDVVSGTASSTGVGTTFSISTTTTASVGASSSY